MVWQVIKRYIVVLLVLIVAFSTTAQAYSVYDGTPSSTYITYFKDIVSGAPFDANYVAFRSDQNEYIMLLGDLEIKGSTISVNGTAKEYKYYTTNTSQYNSTYRYSVTEVSSGSVNVGDYIIYSDLGDYPELVERGDKYEILTLFVLCIMCLCTVISRIFKRR